MIKGIAFEPTIAFSRTRELSGNIEKESPEDSKRLPGSNNNRDNKRATSNENSNTSSAEQKQLNELRRRDQEVRAHEQAHIAAGGSYVRGGANFTYERGPDGKLYAVGGEVSIDASPVPDNPSATITKMETVKRAALAPSQPSAQDYKVAAQAQMEITKAQMEMAKLKSKNAYPSKGNAGTPKTSTISFVA